MTDQSKKEITDLFNKIIGVKPNVEEIFSSPEAREKELFIRTIASIEEINIRSCELFNNFGIDITRMEDMYFGCIDSLISLHFNPQIQEIIYWYLYERFDIEGNEMPLEDIEGNRIFVKDAEVLYDVIKLLE
jgi:hypothetical protein